MAETVGIRRTDHAEPAAIEHRVDPNAAVTPAQNRGEAGAADRSMEAPTTARASAPSSRAVVRAPRRATGPAEGTQSFACASSRPRRATRAMRSPALCYDSVGNETKPWSRRRSACSPCSANWRCRPAHGVAFVVIDTIAARDEAAMAPARSGGWLALEEALFALLGQAPALAEQLRAELTPPSGPDLAGLAHLSARCALPRQLAGPRRSTRALDRCRQGKLTKRLAEDIAALRRLGGDQTTGEWRVLTLPLLARQFPARVAAVSPAPQARLARRRIRFALEAELSRLGPVQLDCLVRANRLILVLRSHRSADAGAARRERRGVPARAAGHRHQRRSQLRDGATFLVNAARSGCGNTSRLRLEIISRGACTGRARPRRAPAGAAARSAMLGEEPVGGGDLVALHFGIGIGERGARLRRSAARSLRAIASSLARRSISAWHSRHRRRRPRASRPRSAARLALSPSSRCSSARSFSARVSSPRLGGAARRAASDAA